MDDVFNEGCDYREYTLKDELTSQRLYVFRWLISRRNARI